MATAYDIARAAVKKFMLEERMKKGPQEAGGGVMDAHTMCIGEDGSVEIIPLDILSDPVNLKNMWMGMEKPVAIAFRDWVYDWCCIIPTDSSLQEWKLKALPGRDHDLHRAQALSERAVQIDFKISTAKVTLSA